MQKEERKRTEPVLLGQSRETLNEGSKREKKTEGEKYNIFTRKGKKKKEGERGAPLLKEEENGREGESKKEIEACALLLPNAIWRRGKKERRETRN